MSDIKKEYSSIRPAGRLMLTIGRDLIKSPSSALLELVKNAYDADSPDVSISLHADREHKRVSIVVADNGHGMTTEVVKNVWLVPATSDKLKRKKSPCGRVLQGRKGVGRFASAILGDELLLETVSDGIQTDVVLCWQDFVKMEYLDQVKVLTSSYKVDRPSGTKLLIEGGDEYLEQWGSEQIKHLVYELRKLIPPAFGGASLVSNDIKKNFKIKIEVVGFGEDDKNEVLTSFPLLELYDYRIAGILRSTGHGEFTYSCNRLANQQDERIAIDCKPTGCGNLEFDIRVYDRDKDALEQLSERGLKDASGRYLKYTETRRLLDTVNGIGVYRNGFRISPLGDADNDWLELNKKRIQNPSKCIGSDQVIGYIKIDSEEASNLIEKSARDGLRENGAYERLKYCAELIIAELESRRLSFRCMMGYGRAVQKLGQRLSSAFGFTAFRQSIASQLAKAGATKAIKEEIIKIIDDKENEQAKLIEDIGDVIALYQGQATLGKIINVILHEGRRPLNYLKNQLPYVRRYHVKFVENRDEASFSKIDELLTGTEYSLKDFVELFGKLDPLAVAKRGKRKMESVAKIIENSIAVFNRELRDAHIVCEMRCDSHAKIDCWRQDIQAIFVNLIDNSKFWMIEKASKIKKISINVEANDGQVVCIDYKDTGPGIGKDLIKSQIIFEPNFSTKVGGTGLGLAIAGEAAQRNALQLSALECDDGAHFRLLPLEIKR